MVQKILKLVAHRAVKQTIAEEGKISAVGKWAFLIVLAFE